MDFTKSQELLVSAPNINLRTVVVVAVFSLLTLLWKYMRVEHDSREPAVVSHPIPYFGHLLGVIRHGLRYYQVVFDRVQLPIYTLNFMSSKVYVVTSVSLASAVERKKTLSFNPFMTSWLKPLYHMDDDTMTIMKNNMDCEEGDFGYMKESYDIHHGMLAARQETLEKLTADALTEFATLINEVDSVSTDLYCWVQHTSTVFGTNAMWGRMNPMADPKIEKSFWTFESKFHLLLLDILPKLSGKGAYQAREEACKVFCDYYAKGVPDDASALVKARIAVGRKYGLTTEALARLDVGLGQALLINTVPISSWMLFHIFSSPPLLEEIRAEVLVICTNGFMDISKFRDTCPLLVSTWQEVLRFASYLPSGRTVLEDTMINDRYLLRKGATVLIPSGIIHQDKVTWGEDASEFNARRFLSSQKRPAAAFRGFGGGTLLCPGRHFAFNEVLAFVATMVIGFDVSPTNGEALSAPERDMFNPSLGVLKPVEKMQVQIKRRTGWENVRWSYSIQKPEDEVPGNKDGQAVQIP